MPGEALEGECEKLVMAILRSMEIEELEDLKAMILLEMKPGADSSQLKLG